MLMLTALTGDVQPDYVALAMVLVLALIVTIMALRKNKSNKNKQTVSQPVTLPTETPTKPAAPGAAGQIKLHSVDPKTAAMLMAIVADKMGRPLNELRFMSIKEVE